jgi:outer membrane protein assembly factor BamB
MKIARATVGKLLLCVVLASLRLWSQTGPALSFKINSTHTGSLQTKGLQPPLSVKWSVDIGGTASYPLIVGGKVFVIGAGSVSTLYALDAKTGTTLWSQPSPVGAWIGAAYENGMVFVVPTSGTGLNGAMYAFAASDGHQVWGSTLTGQYSFSSPPSAYNGIVYTSGAGSGGTVYAVRETDGTVLWTAGVQNGDNSSPAVNGTGVYVSYVCPQTYRFNPTTGKQIWYFAGGCEGGGGNTAVLYEGLLYVRDLYNFATTGITLTAKSGTLVGPGFNSAYSPAFYEGTGFYTESDSLTAVMLSSGSTLWTAAPATGDSYSISPIVVNGTVYIGTSNGNLLGYDATTGANVESMNLGFSISGGEYFAIPQAGLGAGQGLIVVPAGTHLVALQ